MGIYAEGGNDMVLQIAAFGSRKLYENHESAVKRLIVGVHDV